MYDSSLESKITGLKHTWKLKKSRKSGEPPPLPLKILGHEVPKNVIIFLKAVIMTILTSANNDIMGSSN